MKILNRQKLAALAAEFLGTSIIVSAVLVMPQTTSATYFFATTAAVALVLAVMLFGPISGAHFNPAVTFGMWTARLIGTYRAAGYIAAQLLGGLVSWQLYQYLTDRTLPASSQVFDTRIWLAEVIGTFIVSLAITVAVVRGFDLLQSALTYGAAFFVGILIAATAAAGYANPAVALGVRSFDSAYVLGPLVGGLLGVNLYLLLFAAVKQSLKK